MRLEVISPEPTAPVRATPLLFIHGAYSSARLWQPFFLPFFAAHGYPAHALSLRGHGGSKGPDRLEEVRIRDYVADVLEVAEGLRTWPVLIGHSMGGLIVQKIIQDHPLPAAVLMASTPPHGIVPSVLSAALFNPILFGQMRRMQIEGPEAASLDGARRALFRPDTPDEYIRKVLPPAEAESLRVMMDMMGFDLPPSMPRRDVPVLVLGAEQDTCITTAAVESTARAYGTTAEIFPGMPHGMMLDQEWETVARRILEWLEATLPAAPPARRSRGSRRG